MNADILDSNSQVLNYTTAVANPQSRMDISPRFDFQLSANNTLTVRYMFDRQKETNSGVSQFALESQAYDVTNYENTLQVSDTQMLNANTVNETRFQYIRARDNQSAQYADPTITVQGAFTGGGNNLGVVRDNQDRFEFENYTTEAKGAHALKFGGRAAHHSRRELLHVRVQRKLHLCFARVVRREDTVGVRHHRGQREFERKRVRCRRVFPGRLSSESKPHL